jgi:acetyl-CoA carboxylase biotin carboxyl carrier protein
MESHDLREIDLRQAEQQIRLRRGAEITYATPAAPAPPPPQAPAPAPAPVSASVPAETEQAAEDESITYIKSPMVGTFYVRANPNAEAYVRVGDMVEPETTVCIVEAMKVFNEIPAEVRGKVVAVLVEEEEPVDFGRPLFKIDTSAT